MFASFFTSAETEGGVNNICIKKMGVEGTTLCSQSGMHMCKFLGPL